jgi:soluble lytic murein transglycosylase-like protein
MTPKELGRFPSQNLKKFLISADQVPVIWFLLLYVAQTKGGFQAAMEKQRAAVEIQRKAARKQAEAVAQSYGSESAIPRGTADCDPIPDPYAWAILGYAATTQKVDPRILRGVILKESGFRPCAVSPKGARGLMQLMPATIDHFQVWDAFDPKQNVEAGAKYLKQLLEKYKDDISLALAAYNAGPTAVDNAGGIPDIQETRDYVESITRMLGVPTTPRCPPPTPTPKPIGN